MDRQIELLLPCNVVVAPIAIIKAIVIVEAMNPQLLFEVADEPALGDVAGEVTARLQTAIDSLHQPPHSAVPTVIDGVVDPNRPVLSCKWIRYTDTTRCVPPGIGRTPS